MPVDDEDDQFRPRHRDREAADLRLMQKEVRSNAQRLIELEERYNELKDVQEQLVIFARDRTRQWRYCRYYIKVLFDETQR